MSTPHHGLGGTLGTGGLALTPSNLRMMGCCPMCYRRAQEDNPLLPLQLPRGSSSNSLRSWGRRVTTSTPCPLFPLVPQTPVSSSRPHVCPCICQPLGFRGCKYHRGAKVPSLLQDLLGVLGIYLPLLWAVSRRTTCSPSSGVWARAFHLKLTSLPWGKALASKPARYETLGGCCAPPPAGE